MTRSIASILVAWLLALCAPGPVITADAELAGIVVTDGEPGRPVPGAVVTVTGAALANSRGAITDDTGAFRIGALPAGRFTIKVEKPGFIPSMYGARRPARPGTTLVLAEGARLANLNVTLWRGAAIAGTIVDQRGRPVAGIAVRAYREGAQGDVAIPILSNNGLVTDEAGRFRMFGLEPGKYVVSARVTSGVNAASKVLSDARVDELLLALRKGQRTGFSQAQATTSGLTTSYAPVFFPGTMSIDQAATLSLVAGQEIGGIDFAIQAIPVSSITGAARLMDGAPAAGARITFVRVPRSSPRFAFILASSSATVADDGSFSVAQMTPGTYHVTAKYQPPGTPAGSLDLASRVLWATTDMVVSGADVTGLTLTITPGVMVSGTVSFLRDGQVVNPAGDRNVAVQSLISSASAGTSVRPDGTFHFSAPTGEPLQFFFPTQGPQPDWVLRSARVPGGDDWLDVPLTLTSNTDVAVQFTNNHTELTGRLETPDGMPVSDLFVIAFSADHRHWELATRRVRAVRPAADGAFVIADLPPGDYFLGALTDVDPGDWLRPGFLDALVPVSAKVSLAEGGRVIQNLQIRR